MIGPDLLSIAQLSVDDIATVLARAERHQTGDVRTALAGKLVGNLFYENSTRTRLSFELAARRLAADVVNVSALGSSVAKGESLLDTGLTLQALGVDAIVLRHWAAGAAQRLAEWLDVPVLNAGDGMHQHPTQALLDLYTIREQFGHLEGLRVTICGDIAHSRVARSLVQALNTVGAQVTMAAPASLLPTAADTWGTAIAPAISDALADTDVLYLLRVQRERMAASFAPSDTAYARDWGIDAARVAALPSHAIVLHPGPMNRGVELTGQVANAWRRTITAQVRNGVAVRAACLALLAEATVSVPADTDKELAAV